MRAHRDPIPISGERISSQRTSPFQIRDEDPPPASLNNVDPENLFNDPVSRTGADGSAASITLPYTSATFVTLPYVTPSLAYVREPGRRVPNVVLQSTSPVGSDVVLLVLLLGGIVLGGFP